jgi:hypothetical protein
MARLRTRSQFQFETASRQLDTRDLDNITDPTTDLGGAVADAVAEYQTAGGLIAPYPGLDVMEGSISGPLSQLGDDFGALAALMDRAVGYEEYPAILPSLGTWSSPSPAKVRWTPNEPGIYQWYAKISVDLDIAANAATIISFRPGLFDILDETWGGDIVAGKAISIDGSVFQATSQGMLMASQEMLDAGFGGVNFTSPHYQIQGAEVVDANSLFVGISSWSPAGTVPYLDGI